MRRNCVITDFIRYQRQIAVPEINEKGQVTLQQKKVLIIGCGGLGTNVALYLVGAGIGSIVCADDDQVDVSNLHRQIAYRESDIGEAKAASLYKQLNALNHTCKIRQISNRMDDEQLRLESCLRMWSLIVVIIWKAVIRSIVFATNKKTDLVSGAAIGWCGQLSVYRFQETSPCYQCLASGLDLETMAGCRDFGVVRAGYWVCWFNAGIESNTAIVGIGAFCCDAVREHVEYADSF
ncbi:ThiF family adenylyltransferase [Vibrio sp. PP-XX7]